MRFQTFESFTDLVNHVEDWLGGSGSREMAETIADAIRDGAHGQTPLYGDDWAEFIESIDPWAIVEQMKL
jgi:hypothetical protein